MLDISNSNNNNCNNFLEYNQFDRVIYHNGLIQSGMVTEVCDSSCFQHIRFQKFT